MRRQLIVAVAALFLTASAVGAEEPFGSFGGQVGGGNSGAGMMSLHGWALDDDGIAAVDLYVDGVPVGRADYHRARPGVPAGYPDSDLAGFAFRLDTTNFLNGLHTVTVRVRSFAGETTFLEPVVLEFLNTTHNLVPFGLIEFPDQNAELYGNCDLLDPARRYSVVSGWVLDAGVEIGDMGVGYVELLIDGAIYANSRTDCFYSVLTGGLTNCYGLRRLDVEEKFPLLRNAANSGYRFVLDVGALIDFGYVQGYHVLTVRSGDIFTQVANVDEIPVKFYCDENLGNEGAFGNIGVPRNGHLYSGVIELVGWVLDWEGVRAVRIYIDGVFFGFADFGDARPVVTQRYPGYPNSLLPGWHFFLDTTELSDGYHHINVIVFDQLGFDTEIGERAFYVANDDAE